jgi:hypothetical protein
MNRKRIDGNQGSEGEWSDSVLPFYPWAEAPTGRGLSPQTETAAPPPGSPTLAPSQ